jgi:hypothetical protein
MKKFTSFLILLSAILILSCDPSSHEAKKYLFNLNKCINGVVQTEDSLVILINKKMLEGGTSTSVIEDKEETENLELNEMIALVFEDLSDSVDVAVERANLLAGFDGNEDLKNILIGVLETYDELIDNEYQEIIRISMIPSILYTQEDDNEFMRISSYVDFCIGSRLDTFNLKQKEFLMKYE